MDIGSYDWKYLYTSFDGRISRAPYWIASIAMGVASVILQMVVNAILGPFVAMLASLPFLYPAYALMVKRGHDRDRPEIVAQVFLGVVILMNVIAFIPGVNLLVLPLSIIVLIGALALLVDYGFLPGTPGPNRYGPDPLGQAAIAR